jgi:hypothetical protein
VRPLALGAVLLLVLLLVLAFAAYRARVAGRWAAAEARAQWEDGHHTEAGVTVVTVRRVARLGPGQERVLGESVVDRIPDGAPLWHERFSAARQTAYDRMIDLNTRPLLG